MIIALFSYKDDPKYIEVAKEIAAFLKKHDVAGL